MEAVTQGSAELNFPQIAQAYETLAKAHEALGDRALSLREKGDPEAVWNKKTMQNHLSTSVLYEGQLYGVSEGRLRCLDFRTGEVRWNKAGLGRGWVIVADGQLIAVGDHGELFLAKATPKEYVEVSRCTVLDRDKLTWSAPVVSGGRLFIRNENALVALDLTGKEK